jgi:hypothetical protein
MGQGFRSYLPKGIMMNVEMDIGTFGSPQRGGQAKASAKAIRSPGSLIRYHIKTKVSSGQGRLQYRVVGTRVVFKNTGLVWHVSTERNQSVNVKRTVRRSAIPDRRLAGDPPINYLLTLSGHR